MTTFTLRKATLQDLPMLMEIYANARKFMKEHGNESQWGLPDPGQSLRPTQEEIAVKIEKDIQYVCEAHEDNAETAPIIAATFSYTYDIPDPVYSTIYDGCWPDDTAPYGVVHSFASAQTVKGAATWCLNWAIEQSGYLRIDTHPNNTPMISLLKKLGFTYCGKIRFSDLQNNDTLRIAFYKFA